MSSAKSILFLLCFSLTSCQLSDLFGQGGDGDDDSSDTVILAGTDTDGIMSAAFNAGSGSTQILGASSKSEISGSSVSFPAGSLGISSVISIEEGASLAGASLAKQLGVSGGITAKGASVVISSSKKQNASAPFTLKIPDSGADLALAADANLVVIYKIYDKKKDAYIVGVIPKSDLTIKSGFISFQTTFFGAYQAAVSDEKITEAIDVETDTPIVTAAEEAELPEIKWTLGTPTFDDEEREASFPVRVTGFGTLVRCAISIYTSKTAAPIYTAFEVDEDDLNEGDTYYAVFEDDEEDAHSLFAKFECEDEDGRLASSGFSSELEIEEVDDTATSLALSGNSLVSSDPRTRVVASSTSFTMTGSCDSNYTVKINGWGIHTPVDVSCTSGAFTAVIGYDVNVTSTNAYLTDGRGSKEVLISQTGQTTARSILFKTPSNSDITYLGQTTDSDTTALTSSIDPSSTTFYVLEENVTLSGNWTPIGDNTTPFEGAFAGNGKTISNMTIAAAASYVGFFGKIAGGAEISDVVLTNVTITVGSNYNYVGALAGYSDLSSILTSGATGSITVSSASVQNIGGLVGYSNQPYFLRNKAAVNVSAGASSTYVGGYIGQADAGIIEDAYSTGTVSGASKIGGFIGALVANSGAMIAKTYSTGAVTCLGSTGTYCGGFIGLTSDQEGVYASFTASAITAGTGYVGGFAGTYATYGLSGTYFSNAQALPLGNNTDVANSGECEKVTNASSFYSTSHAVYSVSGAPFDFDEDWKSTATYPQFYWE